MAGVPFGRYLLVEKLGEGGMATVYRAMLSGPHQFQRQLVVKRVHASHSLDPDFQRMFIEEARLSALLHHPGIVQVQDFGQVLDEYFLAMEFIEGIDLVTIMQRCAERKVMVPISVACHVLVELASALGYAHTLCDEAGRPLGIVHRDVSPSNVMITRAGAVKLLDFGVAKISTAFSEREATSAGTLKGKISYMSPEQADGRPIDHRSDIFALGIVLYELLTRSRLFRTRDDLETLRRIREAQVEPPSVQRPEIDTDLDAIVLKMLARPLHMRFKSCEEVVAALTPLVHHHHGDMGNTRDFVRSLEVTRRGQQTLLQGAVHGAQAREAGEAMPGQASPQDPAPAPVSLATVPLTISPPPPTQPAWSAPTAVRARALSEEPAEGSIERSSGEMFMPPARAPSSRLPWVLGSAVVAATAMVLFLRTGEAPTPSVTSLPVETPAIQPAATPLKTVRFRIDGDAGARVHIDGAVVGLVPLELELPVRAGPRHLVVELEGRRPMVRDVAGDRDLMLETALPKAETPPPPPPKRRPTSPRPSTKMPEIRDPFAP